MSACVFLLVGNQSFSFSSPSQRGRTGELTEATRRCNSAKIKQTFAWKLTLRQLDLFKPSIQSVVSFSFFLFFFKPNQIYSFILLFFGKQEKKHTFHPLPLKYRLPHVLGDFTCYKSVQSIRVFTPSLRQRGDVTDTVRDTSCACQSGNFCSWEKVQIGSTLTVALVAFRCMDFNVHVFLILFDSYTHCFEC